jgi:hypothetical protein
MYQWLFAVKTLLWFISCQANDENIVKGRFFRVKGLTLFLKKTIIINELQAKLARMEINFMHFR